MAEKKSCGEFELIERYFKPLAKGVDGAFGLEDDAAQLTPRKDCSFVITADTMVEGVHFLEDSPPADAGYKALAVNVSDLCAKGAAPVAYLLSLVLPGQRGMEWLEGLGNGLSEAQAAFGCGLIGGDTVSTGGPAVISITAIGEVPKGKMAHRSGASTGDGIYVTGAIGDAVLGLTLLRGGDAEPPPLPETHRTYLCNRHSRPTPRIDAIELVRSFASASMDISDGLAGDFEKLAHASGVGAGMDVTKVPLSDAASEWLSANPALLEVLMTGGDDYELVMTIPAEKELEFERAASETGVHVARIGVICDRQDGIIFHDDAGRPVTFSRPSFEHFS